MSVLIVEDSQVLAQALAYMVELLGWKACVAHTPLAALQSLRREIPALILLDFNLPGLSGIEILHYIRREPLAHEVEVIFISSEDDPRVIQTALAAGARDYLVKPVDMDQLKDVLDSLPIKHL